MKSSVRQRAEIRGSIPNVAFVKRDIMPFQKRPIFVLEGNRFVMRLLLEDVLGNRLKGRFGNRECCVTVLPRKLRQIPFPHRQVGTDL